MQGVKQQISKSNKNLTEIAKLQTYLDELDRRRNTDWRKTFPWLISEIQHVV